MATSVTKRAPVEDQSLKLRWIQFVRLSFAAQANQSRGARQLNMPHTTLHTNMRKGMKFERYKYQLLQHATAKGKEVRFTFMFLGLPSLLNVL
jgi:hypothetical protein